MEFKVQKKRAESKFRKDENRPKRSASAWMLFLNDERPGLMKQGLAVTEETTKASAMWKKISGSEKEKYENKAAKLKKAYEKEIAAYENSNKYKKYMKEKAAFEEALKAKEPKKVKSASKKVSTAK